MCINNSNEHMSIEEKVEAVFKSFVSTNFTTSALMNFMSIYANIYNWTRRISKFFLF